MIYGERIKLAREAMGLTQTELAARVGISQSQLAKIEGGLAQADAAAIEGIAVQTRFALAFFRREPTHSAFPIGTLLFRARAGLTARKRKQAYSCALLAFEFAATLRDRVHAIPPRIPRVVLSAGRSVEDAAQRARASMGITPDSPIGNVTMALERAGVLVLGLWQQLEDRDAFSLWAGQEFDLPVVALVPGGPGDRLRFSLAHELGHLVLHQALKGDRPDRQIEREADRFAGAFLMPKDTITAELGERPTLTSLSRLKVRWGVSMHALVMRAQAVGSLTTRQAKYLFQQMATRGWRKNEPVQLAREKPRAVLKMAELVYGVPVDHRRVAADMGILPSVATEVLGQYATPREVASARA